MKNVYIVLAINDKVTLNGELHRLDFIDGSPGVAVVFSNKKKAKKYAGKNEFIGFELVKE